MLLLGLSSIQLLPFPLCSELSCKPILLGLEAQVFALAHRMLHNCVLVTSSTSSTLPLTHSDPAALASTVLQCASHTPTLGPLHLLFPLSERQFLHIFTDLAPLMFGSQLECHLLRKRPSLTMVPKYTGTTTEPPLLLSLHLPTYEMCSLSGDSCSCGIPSIEHSAGR